jgi:hypothetical protein
MSQESKSKEKHWSKGFRVIGGVGAMKNDINRSGDFAHKESHESHHNHASKMAAQNQAHLA